MLGVGSWVLEVGCEVWGVRFGVHSLYLIGYAIELVITNEFITESVIDFLLNLIFAKAIDFVLTIVIAIEFVIFARFLKKTYKI